MYYVYLLTHSRCVELCEQDGNIYDTKVLGIYSSHKKAIDAIAFFSQQVGFRDFKDDFHIQKKKILGNTVKEPIHSVFLVEYERLLYEDVYLKRFLGICADEQTAQGVISISKQKSRRNNSFQEYDIIEYEL